MSIRGVKTSKRYPETAQVGAQRRKIAKAVSAQDFNKRCRKEVSERGVWMKWSSTGERVVSSNWPKMDGDNLYAVPSSLRQIGFPRCLWKTSVRECLVPKYEREKLHRRSHYHGLNIWRRCESNPLINFVCVSDAAYWRASDCTLRIGLSNDMNSGNMLFLHLRPRFALRLAVSRLMTGLTASGWDSPMTRQWNFITAACSIKTIWIPGTCSSHIRVRDMPSGLTVSGRDSPLTRQWNP